MRRLLVLLVLFAGVGARAQKSLSYPRLVVFGDNYSDTLNTYNATKTTVQGYDPSGNPTTYTDVYPSTPYGYQDGIFTNGFGTAAGSTTSYAGVWHQQLHSLLPGVPLITAVNLGAGGPQTNYAWVQVSANGTTYYSNLYIASVGTFEPRHNGGSCLSAGESDAAAWTQADTWGGAAADGVWADHVVRLRGWKPSGDRARR